VARFRRSYGQTDSQTVMFVKESIYIYIYRFIYHINKYDLKKKNIAFINVKFGSICGLNM